MYSEKRVDLDHLHKISRSQVDHPSSSIHRFKIKDLLKGINGCLFIQDRIDGEGRSRSL